MSMLHNIQILAIDPSSNQLEQLADEAKHQSYKFVDRLVQEAKAGKNLFDQQSECFLGVFVDGQLVGCGGISIDPYADQKIGRLRHVYVLKRVRRFGIASALVRKLIECSKPTFSLIRLRTSDRDADRFYEALGFRRINEENATHSIEI